MLILSDGSSDTMLKKFEGQGTALVVTKWLAVGAGRSPSYLKLRSLLLELDEDFQPAYQPFPFFAGTTQNAFERQADFEFEFPFTPKIAQQLLDYRNLKAGLLPNRCVPRHVFLPEILAGHRRVSS